jgi:hypothetical protein
VFPGFSGCADVECLPSGQSGGVGEHLGEHAANAGPYGVAVELFDVRDVQAHLVADELCALKGVEPADAVRLILQELGDSHVNRCCPDKFDRELF